MRTCFSIALLLTLAGTAAAQSIRIGSATANRGTSAYGSIAVPAGSDTATDVAIAVVNGSHPGKTVAFIAGSHGTEYASIVALTRLIARIDPGALSGTVIIAPLLNVASFEQMTVHLNPVDKKGMNSQYPGDAQGTQSQRVLAAVRKEIVDKSDVIVDLHGGDLDEDLTPYSYWIRGGNSALDSASHALALAFGLPLIIVTDIDPAVPAQTRSLSGYAIAHDKLTLVAEAGRVGTVDSKDVDALIDGSLNVLAALGMLPRAARSLEQPLYVAGGSRVRAEAAGMFFAAVPRGARVRKEQVLGYTTDYLGRKTGDVRAPAAGVVTFIRGVPSMWQGATLVNVSPVLTTVIPWRRPQ